MEMTHESLTAIGLYMANVAKQYEHCYKIASDPKVKRTFLAAVTILKQTYDDFEKLFDEEADRMEAYHGRN